MSMTSGLSLAVLVACGTVSGATAVPVSAPMPEVPEVAPAAACKAMAALPNESPRRGARSAFARTDGGSDRFRVQMRVLRDEGGKLLAICQLSPRKDEAVAIAPRALAGEGAPWTEASWQQESNKGVMS